MKKKRDITKIKYLFLLLPLLISLSSCDSSQLGDQLGNGIEEKLLPNIWAFLVQLIAFVLLLIAVIFIEGFVIYKVSMNSYILIYLLPYYYVSLFVMNRIKQFK